MMDCAPEERGSREGRTEMNEGFGESIGVPLKSLEEEVAVLPCAGPFVLTVHVAEIPETGGKLDEVWWRSIERVEKGEYDVR